MITKQATKSEAVGSTKGQDYWITLMKFGERLGCHQRPERSLFIKGYQMPVCARCTGAIVGYLIAIPVFLLLGFSLVLSVFGVLFILFDWGLQTMKIKESTNTRRVISGLLGGYGLMTAQLMLIKMVIEFVIRRM
jgi:uncharacterized membrane protein